MGIGGIGIWQLLIILVIVIMLFGTKRLKNLGGDLGGAIKGFKKSMQADEEEDKTLTKDDKTQDKADSDKPDANKS
ncbi:twin-arginine translocase TatA/TatE family subunit [Dasania sp. GY-MA-18]|uniref:Sec-independent protein translocase protein TatA n=1 Tax=Dasania phycosphaerae TaxID=2950436 RepID=A0A9J6RK57_9GAMM|nr:MULTISPECIES: twin-arginine translocase TatA/TatE family subunit [Dasania]MCR8922431.1 twin-arginine translocase TatA/TatE family subunit [Dasania sp. GY-MA-18]MCZ0864859.1 twin-arginine translocase TatA/TatE family subunit [Dasania phycosphaerae]MCZ0868587.1 twin-arginine translocase TatA/TatE family subunit [Dasania phycosphaerae]